MVEHIPDGPIHTFFGLSYAEYIAIPRTALQSMPLAWQERFVAMIDELDSLIDWRPCGSQAYRVSLHQTNLDAEDEDQYWGPEITDRLADYQRGRRRLPLKPIR